MQNVTSLFPPFAVKPARWWPGFAGATPHGPERMPETLGRIGNLEVRLAHKRKEIKRAQRLRYRVFFEEMSAIPSPAARLTRRDKDRYDAVCDHLVVFDHTLAPGHFGQPKKPRVVGTYRLLRQDAARIAGGFYTASEFDIAPLLAAHPGQNMLELGRSCVLPAYRDKRTVELLWQGIWAYILAHDADIMFGCASLEGTDPNALALPLSYLHHYHTAGGEWAARALAQHRVPMDLIPKEAIDPKAALRALPPLIKGYLRLGAMVGDGAVVDRQFGTTDVLMILPRKIINPRYIDYYGPSAGRHAA
ncbi:GNAT family N-acetyltransferase [Terrihabitans sp. B22-R8]|uniref:GNAT family N-acetyltransferase n=1 Tax=Terrihabitans sp. B22-R8 TaxID=3425128 RepID=UPI00403D0123